MRNIRQNNEKNCNYANLIGIFVVFWLSLSSKQIYIILIFNLLPVGFFIHFTNTLFFGVIFLMYLLICNNLFLFFR